MQFKLPARKWQTRAIAFFHDLLAIPIAWFVAYWFRFNLGEIPSEIFSQAVLILPIVILIQGASYFVFGLYRGIWRFASVPDLVRIIKAVLVGCILTVCVATFFTRLQNIPRSVFPLYSILLIVFLGGSRLLYRWARHHINDFTNAKRVMIVGAGLAGEGLVRDLLRDVQHRYKPVIVIDDDPAKQGLEIHGVRVGGKIKHLLDLVIRYDIELIIIAIPSASTEQMRNVVAVCEKAQLPFRTLPSLKDLAAGNISINALREVSIEDLLGREPVSLDWDGITHELTGHTVLVSGGGGSIGSELCRQIARLNPTTLVVIENCEYNLYMLDLELRQKFPALNLVGYLTDVTDRVAVSKVLSEYQPRIVFHAAAYKHVPLLESQLRVAVRNNILGTWILAQEAAAVGVKQFTLISTDKAVNPSNIMGASKRAAEVICQNFSAYSSTHFITVRFGNVLGSAGSVVPLFRQQIAAGGPVTVTHPDITRFFMTIPEASLLILQASIMGKGGEIFVLDMGEPIKVTYLAEQMIKLSGLKVGEDIEIKYTGLRPGEKLYEELFYASECLVSTEHPKILKAKSRSLDWVKLQNLITEMFIACESGDEGQLQQVILQLVPEYQAEQKSSLQQIVSLEQV